MPSWNISPVENEYPAVAKLKLNMVGELVFAGMTVVLSPPNRVQLPGVPALSLNSIRISKPLGLSAMMFTVVVPAKADSPPKKTGLWKL